MARTLSNKRVVIVGGGPGGATTAIRLADLGLKPVVLEAQSGPQPKVGECLTPSANQLLERLGLRSRLGEDGHLESFGNRSVWGSAVEIERDFVFGTRGSGWHLDRRKFEKMIADSARDAGADWRYGWRLNNCLWQGDRWVLNLKTPTGAETLEADFVVDATGRQSRVARQLGARQIRFDNLVGAAVLMKSPAGKGIKDSFTLVEAVSSGWWYSARLPGGALAVVYMTDADLIDDTTTSRWLSLLEATDHTRRRISEGEHNMDGEPHLLPANSARLSTVFGSGWLAVGDAAAAYDPLSSYGISSAMGAGFYAAAAIADFLEGDRGALLTYRQIIDKAYAQYLFMLADHYAIERRWTGEPFWRRRHGLQSSRFASI